MKSQTTVSASMTKASRRIFLYWLFLIIPTLAVGAGALWLLHREQQRINEQAAATTAARQAAVQTRTRLIAENIGLLMADVQSGLMATLTDAPDANPDAYLANWRRTNPLVHDVFLATNSGKLRWGPETPAVTAWLATMPWRPSVRNERERLADMQSFALAAPVAAASTQSEISSTGKIALSESVVEEAPALLGNSNLQVEVSNNVSQYKSARIALQETAKLNTGNMAPQLPLPQISAAKKEQAAAGNDKAKATFADLYSDGLAADKVADAKVVAVADNTGWATWTDAGGVPHLFGWRQIAQRTVLVVEVNLVAIASRLSGILPESLEPGEAYALHQDKTTLIAQVGLPELKNGNGHSKTSAPAIITSLPPSILSLPIPGWTITGYTLTEGGSASLGNGRAFILLSALLIGLFVLSIIGGGSLLMRQARLSAAESAQKTSFVANVSHEFKTPLTTIRLYSELLEQGRIRDEDKRAESLRTIGRETQRLARLVNNVLDFSRLEQGRKKFDIAAHDLREEIAHILDRHAVRIAEAGLKLDLMRTAAPCVVKTDLDAVEQIVINLLDNACKYAASGGEVTVGLSSTGCQPVTSEHGLAACATITVADRGPGIPAAHREKIFEKFHRVDDKLTAAQGGAGLGLSIARQLARSLGGDLTHAPREGGGSIFTLTLPAA